MRCDHLSIPVSQILHYLTEAGIVHIHFRDIDHTRQIVLVTQFPCFFRSHFHAGFPGYDDDSCIRHADRFFYLSDKVKISRSIQDVDLCLLPLDRYQCSADRKFTFLLLFIKIADRISVRNFSHTIRGSGHVGHCLYQTGLSASAMSQQDYVSNFIRSVNLHIVLPPYW